MYTLYRPSAGCSTTRSRISRMSSMPRCDAASISTTSKDDPFAIATHTRHVLSGSAVGPCTQFNPFARMRASDVFPVPRGPAKRYACRTCPAAIAFLTAALRTPDRVRSRGPSESAREPPQKRVRRNEQATARKADAAVERVDVARGEASVSAKRPQRLSVKPRRLARGADVTHRDHIVQAVAAMQEAVERVQPTGDVLRLEARLDAGEDVVDAFVVGVLRRPRRELVVERRARPNERHRQVAVDVR